MGPPEPPPFADPNLKAASTIELTKRQSGIDLPSGPGKGTQGTFDLPLMHDDDFPPSVGRNSGSGTRHVSDAATLFDDRPIAPRRKAAGDARMEARRCPTCGSVIPPGMSLCRTCGHDLETGTSVSLVDDLSPPPVARQEGIPGPVAVVGFLCLAISIVCTLAALGKWMGGTELAIYLLPATALGLYGSVQFLRCKTPKLLLAALTLGAAINIVGFLVLPVFHAIYDDGPVIPPSVASKPETTGGEPAGEPEPEAEPKPAEEVIDAPYRPVSERVDTQQLFLGIALLGAYAILSIYILSPTVQRHFRHHRP